MGDEPRRQGGLARPGSGLPPGVGIGAGAELGPLRQLTLAADQRVGGGIADLFQVGRQDKVTGSDRDDIRQPARERRQPEPGHQLAQITLWHLVISPVDAPGGKPAGALTKVMLGYHGDDPPGRPHRRSRHAGPRRGTPRLRRGGRRVVQVHRQGALTAVSGHRRVPGDLLQVPEHPEPAISGIAAQLEPREPEGLHREHGHALADPAKPRRLDLAPRGRVRGDHDHGKIGTVVPDRVGPPSRG